MKSKKIILVGILVALTFTSSVRADETESAAVQELREQQQNAESLSSNASRGRSTIETDLTSLEEERAALNDENDPDKSKRKALDERIANQETNLQIARIEERSKQLIAANKAKAIDIQKEIDACNSKCEEREILERQKAANAAYEQYLMTQRDADVCRATSCPELTRFEAVSAEKANLVKSLLAELTKIETTRNTLRTFEVSDVFRLPGQDVSDRTIEGVVETIANWMITLVSSLAVTALIIGGFMMIISGGDETRLELGKTIFTYSLIGLLVTLLSFGIITFLQSLFY